MTTGGCRATGYHGPDTRRAGRQERSAKASTDRGGRRPGPVERHSSKIGREAGLETTARDDHRPRTADTPPEAPVPAGWHDSLARRKVQVAAGESVPLLPVLDSLRASAERPEAEQGVTADRPPRAFDRPLLPPEAGRPVEPPGRCIAENRGRPDRRPRPWAAGRRHSPLVLGCCRACLVAGAGAEGAIRKACAGGGGDAHAGGPDPGSARDLRPNSNLR